MSSSCTTFRDDSVPGALLFGAFSLVYPTPSSILLLSAPVNFWGVCGQPTYTSPSSSLPSFLLTLNKVRIGRQATQPPIFDKLGRCQIGPLLWRQGTQSAVCARQQTLCAEPHSGGEGFPASPW